MNFEEEQKKKKTKEMMEDILSFFYEKISKRVKEKVENYHLTYEQIYATDSKLISRIVNNKRGKNNPYLVTKAVFRHFYDENYSDGLIPILNFNDEIEILWGTKEEIKNYLFDLFKLLWDKVIMENKLYEIDGELYLCDYVPYAKYSTYWEILLNQKSPYPLITYGIMEDDVTNNIDRVSEEALERLYKKCKKDFENMFFEFADKTDTFKKIDCIFRQNFIEELYIPMLNKLKPHYEISLGLRVKALINADLCLVPKLIHNDMESSDYIKGLINASSQYILKLEEIQKDEFKKIENE